MGRPKKFSREGVLEKALPVFWKHGFYGTSVQDLERATGVNKSGLYSEFRGKEDLFLESLRYYFETRGGWEIINAEPSGWHNIERFLRLSEAQANGQAGCFSVNSMREFSDLPAEVHDLAASVRAQLKPMIVRNIEAEHPKMAADAIAELVMVFFSGICIEQNTASGRASVGEKISSFMTIARSL
ncbi:TetR/AcrR family transcriptional regulator [Pseudomonas batumici]|uniref:TetR/AcrR family transcriptional regulator n=1 Tax=Pseudomonas batumici TaxID=226910 RepID=UPI0030D46E7C